MLTVLINGSPKAKDSASGVILGEIKSCLPGNMEVCEVSFRSGKISGRDMECINRSDRIILAFPLYVDCVPSNVLRCLEQIENAGANVYAVCNSGFYEAGQNALALDVIKNWCIRNGLNWKRGIGLGGGGAVVGMQTVPLGKGPKKNMGKAFSVWAENVADGTGGDNIYVSIGIPRAVYKMAADMGWKKLVKENGLKAEDLNRRI